MIRFIKYSVANRRREKNSRKWRSGEKSVHNKSVAKKKKRPNNRKGMWKSAGKSEFNTKWNQPKIVNYLSFL